MKRIIFLLVMMLGVAFMAQSHTVSAGVEQIETVQAATATYYTQVIRLAKPNKPGVVGLYQRISCTNGSVIGESMVQTRTYTHGTVFNQAYTDAWYDSLPQTTKDALSQLVSDSQYLCP